MLWGKGQIDYICNIFEIINWKMSGLKLNVPNNILLILTTGKEEGHAAYCRSNTIVLPQQKMKIGRYNLERLLIHELFHIYSQNHPKETIKLYEILGFHRCENIQYHSDIKNFIITNPDTCKYPCYIEISDDLYTPILYSKTEFDSNKRNYNYDRPTWKGGSYSDEITFFDYIEFGLLKGKLSKKNFIPILKDNKSIILNEKNKEIFNNYLKRVGKNTDYYIHPEEILAENFMFMVNHEGNYVKNPDLLLKIRKKLNCE